MSAATAGDGGSAARAPRAVEFRLGFRRPGRGSLLVLVAIELLVGVPAIPAGIGLARDGLGMQRGWISHSLFPDYTIPGVLLAVVIGGGMVGAAVLSLRRPSLAGPAALVMGAVQVLWLAFETCIVGWHGGPQALLVGLIGLLAATLVVVGCRGATLRLCLDDAAGA